MKTIKTNGSVTDEISGRSVAGIMFSAYLIAAAVNTALVAGDIDFEKVQVKATLNQGGKKIDLVNTDLSKIAALQFSNAGFKADKQTPKVLLAHGVAVKANALTSVYYDFGSVINLKGDEFLKIEITGKGWAGANLDTTLSEIRIDWEEGIGVQEVIPVVEVMTIDNDTPVLTESLGNGITEILLINDNVASILEASAVMTNNTIESDKFNNKDTYLQSLLKRQLQFESATTADARNMNFQLYKGIELNSTKLTLDLTVANVTAGKNYILLRRNIWSLPLAQRANAISVKHAESDFNILKRS